MRSDESDVANGDILCRSSGSIDTSTLKAREGVWHPAREAWAVSLMRAVFLQVVPYLRFSADSEDSQIGRQGGSRFRLLCTVVCYHFWLMSLIVDSPQW